MDYLQTLEFRMAALQRKIRLLQDLRYFVESSSPEEFAAFGEELEAGHYLLGSQPRVGSWRPFSAPPRRAALAGDAKLALRPASLAVDRGRGGRRAARGAPARGRSGGSTRLRAASAERRAAKPSVAPGAAFDGRALFEASMKAIPASSFIMGSEANDDEKPPHKVELGAFRLCDHLVTNKEYSLFVAANPQWSKDRADPELRDENYLSDWSDGGFPEGKDEHPVAFVSFFAPRPSPHGRASACPPRPSGNAARAAASSGRNTPTAT